MKIQDNRSNEELFYSNPFEARYSSLKMIPGNPRKFFKEFVLDDTDEENLPHMMEGTLVHAMILQNGSLEQMFKINDVRMPSEAVAKIVDQIYLERDRSDPGELADYGGQIIQLMDRQNFYANIKDEDKRILKVTGEGGSSYWTHLNQKSDKRLVDPVMWERAERSAMAINQHKEALRLLTLGNQQGIVMDEKAHKVPFGHHFLKGTLDNIKIVHSEKAVYVNDLKNINQPLSKFREEYVENYSYWLQGAIYKRLATDIAQTLGLKDFTFHFHFIVCDVNDMVYCFPVSSITLDNWEDRLQLLWKRFLEHYKAKDFSVPLEFMKLGGIIL